MEKDIVITILNATVGLTNFDDFINMLITQIKEYSGFKSVGIRIEDNVGDYPYYMHVGFSEDFIRTENSLLPRNRPRSVVYASGGNGDLECVCGAVIKKCGDPTLPFFTENGSFVTNSTTEFLKSAHRKKLKISTRDRCPQEGYESVGLFPLDTGDRNIGLIQLNDQRTGMFNENNIQTYEVLAKYTARIVHDFLNVIKKLKETETKLQERINYVKKFNKLMLKRELKILELKEEIRYLKEQLKQGSFE